ncbi:MAG: class I SAM-dependent methyltransferase [Pyrinomonadaceae bacterium]
MTQQTNAQIREHYEIERSIADRLRNSSAAERRELYRTAYDDLFRRVPHHPMMVERSDSERRARTAKEVSALRPLVDDGTVYLEIGPGDCSTAVAMAGLVKKVYAADVSAEIASQFTPPENFELLLFDGLSIPLPGESVDVAYSNQLMEHLHPEDSLVQLESIYRVLRPGGVYYCVTPNRLSGPHDVSRGFDPVATCLHLKEFTVGELERIFADAGFRRMQVYLTYAGRGLKLPVWPFKALESLIAPLPHRVRRWLTFNRIAKFILGIKLIATK